MSELIYFLCMLTSLMCCWLLLRAWRKSRSGILLWSGLCFAALGVNNVLLVADKVLTPLRETLTTARLAAGALAVGLLLWGLIFEER